MKKAQKIFEKNWLWSRQKVKGQFFFKKKGRKKVQILTLRVHRNSLRLQMFLKLCQYWNQYVHSRNLFPESKFD